MEKLQKLLQLNQEFNSYEHLQEINAVLKAITAEVARARKLEKIAA